MAIKTGSIFEQISDPIRQAIAENDFSGEQAAELVDELIKNGPNELLNTLLQGLEEMVDVQLEESRAFEERNHGRWKKPLDLLSAMWIACSELSEEHAHEGPVSVDKVVFDTLAHLQPRALLIASEIQCLLRGGFADGAMTRWRSLHEVVTTAIFIKKHGSESALKYRMSAHFRNYKVVLVYNEYCTRIHEERLIEEELAYLKLQRDEA